MRFNTRQTLLVAATFFISSPVFAVDLVGVHDLAVKNDPALQAAAYRKEATGENKRQAWANLLPSLNGSASMTRGNTKTSVSYPGVEDDKSDTDTERWGLDLRQSLYAQSNYEQLDVARGQVSQAEVECGDGGLGLSQVCFGTLEGSLNGIALFLQLALSVCMGSLGTGQSLLGAFPLGVICLSQGLPVFLLAEKCQ